MDPQTEQPTAEATAGATKAKKERKPKAPKVAPPALKDIPDETLAHHADKYLVARLKLKDAMKEVSAIRGEIGGILDVAKKDGIPKQKLKDYADAMDKDAVEQRETLEFIGRMARIMGDDSYLEQMEMFAGAPEERKKAAPKAEGRAAGKAGRNATENPYPPGSEAHQEWDVGYRGGQAEIVRGMAPKGTTPSRRARTAADREDAGSTLVQ